MSTPSVARGGASLLFLTNGLLFANLLPRYPEIKEAFGLSGTEFGFMVAMAGAGAICASALPSPLIGRFGARTVAIVSSLSLASLLVALGFAPNALVFGFLLILLGFSDAITDAAQNVLGMQAQRMGKNTIINSLHALWSAGAVLGGVLGTFAASMAIPLSVHLAVISIPTSLVVLVAGKMCAVIPSEPNQPKISSRRAAWGALIPLGVLALSGVALEDVANNWSALFLRSEYDAVGKAGSAFVLFMIGQFVGRFSGDLLTDRFGMRAVTRTGGLLVLIGMSIVIFTTTPLSAISGFAITGFGCSTLVPAAYAASDAVPGWEGGMGIALLGWIMRVGLLVTSPLMGTLSDAISLRFAFVLPLTMGLVAAFIAQRYLADSSVEQPR